jgi:ribosomal protein RSM22 (predicted rRNA methylase)
MTMTLAALLARPLEEDWRASLERVARGRRWLTLAEPERLGALVRALSEAYNAPPGRAVASSAPALSARLGFSFARDVPKSGGAVRELVASGELGREDRPLRVLDVGAGLGATTWGVARALAAAGLRTTLEVTWCDEDQVALDVAVAIARDRHEREGDVAVHARVERRRAAVECAGKTAWDLILLGQVLSELDPALEPGDRTRKHAELVAGFVGALAPGGAVVVVEPALCERTRHLHGVRDAVLVAKAASVFAPCLHASPCPALLTPGDWCHEDAPIDLPPWLVPVARAAGLRWQGLTYSYLVLRRPGERTLADVLPHGPGGAARVISGPLVSKGKREYFVCGELLSSESAGAERARVSRLDRDRTEANVAWDALGRGDVVAIDPPPDPKKHRITREAAVKSLVPGRTRA